MDAELRDVLLTRAAVRVADEYGLAALTIAAVADHAEVPPRTVYRWCRNRNGLRKIVIAAAHECGAWNIVAEANGLGL